MKMPNYHFRREINNKESAESISRCAVARLTENARNQMRAAFMFQCPLIISFGGKQSEHNPG